jgi:hypothetical protein
VVTDLKNEANRVRLNGSTLIEIIPDKPMNLRVFVCSLRKVLFNRTLANALILLSPCLEVALCGLLLATWIVLGLAFAVVGCAEILGVIQFD